uniref:Unannotated protein n=1 Tax=freshwater metagenome TaxID=449393 RepID=A0A6J7MBI5_9ZZZZ
MPHEGRMPNFTWVSPSFASSAVNTRSQAMAISRAPVKQNPFTLAIVTLGMPASAVVARRAGMSRISPIEPSMISRPASDLRSTPAENARPSPVSTTTRTLSSPASCSRVAASR